MPGPASYTLVLHLNFVSGPLDVAIATVADMIPESSQIHSHNRIMTPLRAVCNNRLGRHFVFSYGLGQPPCILGAGR